MEAAGPAPRPDGSTPDDAGPDVAAGPEERCEAVCDKMVGFLFPLVFCEDFGGYVGGAYFCDEASHTTTESCSTFCRRVLVASPSDRCREAWGPVEKWILASPDYVRFVLDLYEAPRACLADLLEMKSACWEVDRVQRERRRWTERRPASYRFRFSQSGDGLEGEPGVDVIVRDDRVVSPDAGPALTIDQLFDALDTCTSVKGESESHEVDPAYPFPSSIECQRAVDRGMIGRWRSYGATDFAPLP
jgi:hypothetical protein